MNIIEELRNKQSRDNRELLDRAANRIEELERETLILREVITYLTGRTADDVVVALAKQLAERISK